MDGTLLSSHVALVFAMGMVSYIALVHVWFWRRDDPVHGWVVVWCLLTLAFQAGRHVQLHTVDPDAAVAAARLTTALGLPLVLSLVAAARCLAQRPPGATATAVGLAACAVQAAAVAGTDGFIRGGTDTRLDWFGEAYIGAPAGPAMALLVPAVALALVYAVHQIQTRSALGRGERLVLLCSLAAYAIMGLGSVLSALRLIPVAAMVEFGPPVVAVGLNYLLVQRHRRLQTGLEEMVAERTAEIAAAHAQLADSESRYRGLVENAPVGVFACDRSGTLVAMNARLRAIVGSPREELTDLNVLSYPPLVASGGATQLRRCMETGETLATEGTYTSRWRKTVAVHLTTAALRDGAGRVIGALGIVEDVSERRALERRLRQVQKMESVGQLAAGIAHEINNPMAYVRSNLSVLRGEWPKLRAALDAGDLPPEVRSHVEDWEGLIDDALEGVERTVAIVRDMKEFSHAGGEERREADLNQLVEASVRVASTHRRGAARLEESYGALPPLVCAPGPLRQVFVNLIVNALQAVGEEGAVRVETGTDGGDAVVRVEDEGPGIPPEIVDRLFDPFFTTKRAGEGTGLGLYVSYEIVRLHAGEIRVQSRPGEGSRFEVRLPLAQGFPPEAGTLPVGDA